MLGCPCLASLIMLMSWDIYWPSCVTAPAGYAGRLTAGLKYLDPCETLRAHLLTRYWYIDLSPVIFYTGMWTLLGSFIYFSSYCRYPYHDGAKTCPHTNRSVLCMHVFGCSMWLHLQSTNNWDLPPYRYPFLSLSSHSGWWEQPIILAARGNHTQSLEAILGKKTGTYSPCDYTSISITEIYPILPLLIFSDWWEPSTIPEAPTGLPPSFDSTLRHDYRRCKPLNHFVGLQYLFIPVYHTYTCLHGVPLS